jgi:hypothetical protein
MLNKHDLEPLSPSFIVVTTYLLLEVGVESALFFFIFFQFCDVAKVAINCP